MSDQQQRTWSDFGIEVPAHAGGDYRTTCPKCSPHRSKPNDRCLSVNVEKEVWNCFHCEWAGTLKQGQTDQPRDPKTNRRFYRRPEQVKETGGKGTWRRWLHSRGITDAVIERNGVGVGQQWFPQIEAEAPGVYFPYTRHGVLINRKWRASPKHFRMEAGAELGLYKADDIAETTLICEGELDALACEVAGFPNAVSVPNGAPPPNAQKYESHFAYLEAEEERLGKVKTFILALDADEPGQRLEAELARRLGADKCERVVWPDGCKDANDVLVKHGADTLHDIICRSEPLPVKGVARMASDLETLIRLHAEGRTRGLSTGWPEVDKHYTVQPGELTVVTGIPNMGKSPFIDNLMCKMIDQHGWRFAVHSPESYPVEEYKATLIEKWQGEAFWPGWNSHISAEKVAAAANAMDEHVHILVGDEEAPEEAVSLTWILEKTRLLVLRHGIRGLIIDPWNELEHQRPRELTEHEYVGMALGRLKRFARVNGVHVWVLAHPKKIEPDKEGAYPVPTPYDISGSANWRNKPDNCLCVWRDFQQDDSTRPETHVYVQKVKRKGTGRLGYASLGFVRATGTLYSKVRPGAPPP